MNKIHVLFVLCIMLSGYGLYSMAYTVCGEDLIFTAEGDFERITIKTPNGMIDMGYIYEDGGTFLYPTGSAPKNYILMIIIQTSDVNYYDYVHTVPIASETFKIGDVQITIESKFEPVGAVNTFEWAMIVLLGLTFGLLSATLVVMVSDEMQWNIF